VAFSTLVSTETLAHNLDSDWCLFDCRFVLVDPKEGERRYFGGHIPDAHFLSLDKDLAGPVTASSGRHPLPVPTQLAMKLAKAGVNSTSQVIAYDDASGAFAARLWWLLRWLGHTNVAVLDGGITKWIKEHRIINQQLPRPVQMGDFKPCPDDALWVNSEFVLKQMTDGYGRLLDARAFDRFQGVEEPIDAVAGHVPGAVNLPFTESVSDNDCFKSSAALKERFKVALDGIEPAQTVCMCGSGVTACHSLLAMEVAGMEGARLYPGSWSEWIRDPSHPVERG
jgi:thiosulfate/3-mercaptopyruvate sulfurtransferase